LASAGRNIKNLPNQADHIFKDSLQNVSNELNNLWFIGGRIFSAYRLLHYGYPIFRAQK